MDETDTCVDRWRLLLEESRRFAGRILRVAWRAVDGGQPSH
jgi:hypothetical protein